MDTKKLIVAAVAATTLALGGGAAIAAQNAAPEATDTRATEEQEPSYKGSITAPADREDEAAEEEQSEAAEGKEEAEEPAEALRLQSLAKIDKAAAEEAALAAVPGTVEETDLEEENGYVVYGVEVAGNDGKTYDVKVDAGNGEILHRQVDGPEEPGDAEDAN